MKMKYVSPNSTILEVFVENAIMSISDPSFDVDNSQESDIVLSNKQDKIWNNHIWSEIDKE